VVVIVFTKRTTSMGHSAGNTTSRSKDLETLLAERDSIIRIEF